jgi:hypothetical protein
VIGGMDILNAVPDHDRSRPDTSQGRCLGTSSAGFSLSIKRQTNPKTTKKKPITEHQSPNTTNHIDEHNKSHR